MRWFMALCVAVPGAAAAQPEEPARARTVIARTFPFEMSSTKVYVKTLVNGQGPYDFALDTAAPPTVIDSDLAKELGIPVTPAGQVGGAGEGSTAMGLTGPYTLEFGGARYDAKSRMASPLNARLSEFGGRPIHGLIGNDWVTGRVVKIDYAARTITAYEGDWEYDGDGVIIPALSRGYTFVQGSVTPPGGEPIATRWVLDTGAGLTANLNTHFVNRHDLLSLEIAMVEATVGFGMGGEVTHHVARMGGITIGGGGNGENTVVEVDRPWVALSQDRRGALASTAMDGIIGGEILSRYTVIFDGPRKRVIFEPSAPPGTPLEWDMSGLTVTGGGEGGRLKVLRVIEGGPGDQAGIVEGDVIVGVDGHEFTEGQRDEVRALLKGDGARRRLRLLRKGEPVEVEVVLRRLVMGTPEGHSHT